jgi:cytochrome c oxidase subunit IV
MSVSAASMGTKVKPHKSPNYWLVFIALALFTALMTVTELYRAYIPLSDTAIHTCFIIISLVKATLVAMYYMHLKFDSRIYTTLFLMPVLFALFLVGVLAVNYFI